jgi:hypothetical protein
MAIFSLKMMQKSTFATCLLSTKRKIFEKKLQKDLEDI